MLPNSRTSKVVNRRPWVRENILSKRNYTAKCQFLIEYGLFKNQSRGFLLRTKVVPWAMVVLWAGLGLSYKRYGRTLLEFNIYRWSIYDLVRKLRWWRNNTLGFFLQEITVWSSGGKVTLQLMTSSLSKLLIQVNPLKLQVKCHVNNGKIFHGGFIFNHESNIIKINLVWLIRFYF